MTIGALCGVFLRICGYETCFTGTRDAGSLGLKIYWGLIRKYYLGEIFWEDFPFQGQHTESYVPDEPSV